MMRCANCGCKLDSSEGEYVFMPGTTYPDYWACYDCLGAEDDTVSILTRPEDRVRPYLRRLHRPRRTR